MWHPWNHLIVVNKCVRELWKNITPTLSSAPHIQISLVQLGTQGSPSCFWESGYTSRFSNFSQEPSELHLELEKALPNEKKKLAYHSGICSNWASLGLKCQTKCLVERLLLYPGDLNATGVSEWNLLSSIETDGHLEFRYPADHSLWKSNASPQVHFCYCPLITAGSHYWWSVQDT